ncbi:uncharacterized protein EV422DRAFT_427972 [Fimicolochytrium jonesii]|uniref:uncharacterized protein n=1 Tax=Fimicolochytrium jonesii TaxID=1396493 RepID=UPI0022FEE90C|nr:uncharacterized protein EV422DRAFT_427972 [Fimicolochytrium jonesii]KAI8821682.1 hypothetical protein EV422DRAFT_427972 [Fimicolochytrium jonesii]
MTITISNGREDHEPQDLLPTSPKANPAAYLHATSPALNYQPPAPPATSPYDVVSLHYSAPLSPPTALSPPQGNAFSTLGATDPKNPPAVRHTSLSRRHTGNVPAVVVPPPANISMQRNSPSPQDPLRQSPVATRRSYGQTGPPASSMPMSAESSNAGRNSASTERPLYVDTKSRSSVGDDRFLGANLSPLSSGMAARSAVGNVLESPASPSPVTKPTMHQLERKRLSFLQSKIRREYTVAGPKVDFSPERKVARNFSRVVDWKARRAELAPSGTPLV